MRALIHGLLALLLWAEDPSAQVDRFNVERALGPCSNPGAFAAIGQSTVTTYTDNDALLPLVPYCYRVNAQNASGVSPYSNLAQYTAPLAYSCTSDPAIYQPLLTRGIDIRCQ